MSGLKIYRDEKEREVTFHIGNILIYAVLYGTALFFYLFLYGYMQFLILVLLTLLPVISIACAYFLSARCSVRLTVSEQKIARRESVSVGILLYNHTVLNALDARFHVGVKNTFYQTQAELIVSSPALMRTETKTELPFLAERNGIMQITVSKMEIKDFCGLVSFVVPLNLTRSVTILPESMEVSEEEKAGFFGGVADNEEDISKGNDFADTSNIREYVPGDRMKDIHWKLSAKKDVLLVKERIRMAESQLIVWLNPEGSPEQTDQILQLAYNLIRLCVQEGILIKLMWYSDKEQEAKEYLIGKEEELPAAFFSVYTLGICYKEEAADYVEQSSKKPVRAYVRIGLQNGKAEAVVVEHDI